MAVEALSSSARRPAVDDTAIAQASFATEAQRTLQGIPVRLELLNPTINRALPQNGFERAADGFWRPLRQLLGTDDPLNNNQTAHVRYWAGKAGLEVSPQGTIDLPNTRDGGRLLATMNFQEIGYSGSFSNGRPGGMLDFEQLKRQQGMSPDFVAGYEEAANQIKTGQAFAWLQLLASGAVSLATARPQPTTVIVEQGTLVRPPAGGLGGQGPRPPIQLTETFPGSGVYTRPGQAGGPIQTSPGGGLTTPGGVPGGLVPSRPTVPTGVAAGAPPPPAGIAPAAPSGIPTGGSQPIYGPGNPEGIAQAAQAADVARRQLQAELNGLSQAIPIPSSDGVNKVSFGGFTWADAQGRAAEYNNGRADGTIAVPVPYERRYGTQGGLQERREPTVYVGGPVQILNAVANDKAAGRVPGDYDVRGQAAQVGAPNFDDLLAADVANRAYAIESNAPTKLYGNTAVPFPTRVDAARAAQGFNAGSSGADPVALAVPLEVRVQGPGVDRTAVVPSVYPGSPDQMSAYFNEMKRQGRIPDGVTFDQCLRDSGIGGSYPARVTAAHDLRAAEAEVKSPTTLFDSTVGVRPTKGEAVNYAVNHNAGTSGADQVVLYVPLTRDVSGPPGVSGRGTAHTLYQNTPDKLRGFVDEMKRQGRVPGDVTFEELLDESGLAGSFPGRLEATRPPVTVQPQTPAPITAPARPSPPLAAPTPPPTPPPGAPPAPGAPPTRPSPPLAATTPDDPPPPGSPPAPGANQTPPQTPPQSPTTPPPLVPQPPTGGVDPITGLTPAPPLTTLTEARSYLRQFGMDLDDTPFPGSPGRHSNAEIAELVTAIRPEIEQLTARYPGLLDGVKISTHSPSPGLPGGATQTAAETVGPVIAFRDPGFLNDSLPKHGVTIGDIFRHEMGHVTWNKTSPVMQAMLQTGAQPQAVIDNSGRTPGSMTWMQYAREFQPDLKTDFMALYPDGSQVRTSDLMKKDGPPFLATKKSADPNPLQNTGGLVSSYGGSLPMEAIAELFNQYTRPSGPSMTGPGDLPHITGEGKPGLQAMPPAGTTQNMFLAIQDAMGAKVAADGTITPVANPMVFDFVRRAGADPLDDAGGPSPAGGPPTPGGLPPLGSQAGSGPMPAMLPPSGSGDAFADRFITRGDPASPTNRRLTEGLEEIVDGVAQRVDATQGGDLQSIIDWAGPKRQALQQEIAPADERSPDYGVERQPGKAGRRMTLVNADTFRQYVEPTLDFLQRNWNDVTLLNGAKPPVSAEAMREAINDPTSGANKLAYTHTMPSPDGDIPLSRVIVTPRENDPVPMALWAYPENPDDIADAKAELSRRWEEMRAVPPGDPRAVQLTAEFTVDYLKLLWQVRGNESIALTLAAGYLEAKGFEMPGLAPGVALGPMAQTSTRDEFIARFTDGAYFKAPIRPKP